MKKEIPIDSNLNYQLKQWSFLVFFVSIDVVLFALLIYYLGNFLYFIIAITIIHLIFIVFFGRVLTKQIVFPFSVGIIKRQQHSFLNQRLTAELSSLFVEVYDIIEKQMLQGKHKTLLYTKYKDYNKKLVKMCDLLDIFATVNQQILKKDFEKQMKNKKRASKITAFFKDATECLTKIEKLMKDIRIVPAKGPDHTIWSYYQGLGDFERVQNDTIQTYKNGQLVFPPERMLPIILLEDQIKIAELAKYTKKFQEYCDISQKPVLCCRKRRTSCFCCFRPLFGGTKQMGLILSKTFDGVKIKLKTDDKQALDCMFFTATCETLDNQNTESAYKDHPTFIFCNPNAMFYQHMVNSPHAFYLKLFLNKNINVMAWNYRGYGLSSGSPNPVNVRKDADIILKYMREQMGLRGKIGVYGRSLGGIPTTHLSDKVDMIIADRTFCNFEILANRKFYSKFAKHLFKFGSCGWAIDNDCTLINSGIDTCYKVLMTEKADEVVEVHSSLMMGVARQALQRGNLKVGQNFILTSKEIDTLSVSARFLINVEQDLFAVIDYQGKKKPHSLEKRNTQQYCLNNSGKQSTQSKVSPDQESLSGLNDSSQIHLKIKNDLATKTYKECLKRLRISLQIDPLLNAQDHIDFLIDIWISISDICDEMYLMQGAMLTFYDIINVNKDLQPLEIENFFILMEVYGVCPSPTSTTQVLDHRARKMMSNEKIETTCTCSKENIEALTKLKLKNPDFTLQIDLLLNHCSQLLVVLEKAYDYLQKQLFIEERQIELSPKRVGHIIPVSCGHTGLFSNDEAFMLDKHLKQAGFLQPRAQKLVDLKSIIHDHQHNQIISPRKIISNPISPSIIIEVYVDQQAPLTNAEVKTLPSIAFVHQINNDTQQQDDDTVKQIQTSSNVFLLDKDNKAETNNNINLHEDINYDSKE